MTDANRTEAVGIPSGSTVPQISSSASPQRHRPIAVHRRAFSAPDLYAPSRSGSASSSAGAQDSSGSSLYSHPRLEGHSLEFHRHRPHITPLATVHSGERSRRFTSAPATAITPVPPALLAPAPEAEENITTQNIELMSRSLEEIRRALSRQQRRHDGVTLRGLWVAARGLFGYGPEGTAARRESISLAWKLLFGTAQITVTIVMLRIGAVHTSPTDHSRNEWQACTRPLGVWCSIWIIRVFLGCFVAISAYQTKARQLAEATEYLNQSRRSHERALHAQSPANDIDARPSRNFVNDSRPTRTRRNNSRSTQARPNQQASAAGVSRLSSFLSFLSFIWFITAHVLTFTTVDTCRLSSPHLWWLTFAIICIGYFVILEVVVIAFLVFIIWPVIYVLINIILICFGRHPLRTGTINPDIGKLSLKAVDDIPLVLYIPAPNEAQSNEKLTSQSSRQGPPMPKLTIPEPAHIHSYPPDTERTSVSHTSVPGTPVPSRSRRLFTFRRIRPKKNLSKDEDKGKETQFETSNKGYRYEDKWEKGEYPFVILEDNRAACAICLCDFDEPRRVRYSLDSKPPEDLDQAEKGEKDADGDIAQVETKGGLKLTDAGEGAQPLRLLDCAHVFHKTCLDPWLTGVSGRCPVCQRPVEVKVPKKNQMSR